MCWRLNSALCVDAELLSLLVEMFWKACRPECSLKPNQSFPLPLLRKKATGWFLEFTSELLAAQTTKGYEQAFRLFRDWTAGRARLWVETVCKFAYFRQLPWCLLGLSHPERVKAIAAAAQHALRMYDLGGPGVWHKQSQRFLSPTFCGTAADPGLRQLVVRLARAKSSLDDGMEPLNVWLARMSCVRMSERTVEGIHARMTQVLRRAPNASMPYISLELRFEAVLQAISKSPDVAWLSKPLVSYPRL